MTNQDIIEHVQALDQLGVRTLAAAAGVPYSTLEKVKYRQIKDPGGRMLDKLRPFVPEKRK